MTDVKPCPFCGKKPITEWEYKEHTKCYNEDCCLYDITMTIDEWNNRNVEDTFVKTLEQLCEAGGTLREHVFNSTMYSTSAWDTAVKKYKFMLEVYRGDE